MYKVCLELLLLNCYLDSESGDVTVQDPFFKVWQSPLKYRNVKKVIGKFDLVLF